MSTTRTNTMGDDDICGTRTIEDVIELTANTRRRIRSLARTIRFGKELLCLGRFLGKVECLVGSLEECISFGERLKCQSPGGADIDHAGPTSSSSLLHSSSSLNQQHAMFASLYSGDTEYPCADLEDIVDAVEGVDEAAAATERQASVERFLLLEQNQEMLKVVASDLGYSITTFEPLLPLLPEDVNEDYWILQKQLTELSFFADPDAVTIANDAVNGVVLHYYGCMSDERVADVLAQMLLRLIDEDVGDAPLPGQCIEWTMDNVSSLYKAAMMQKIGGDYSVYFQYLLLAQGVAVMLCDALPGVHYAVLGQLDDCLVGWEREQIHTSQAVTAWKRMFEMVESLDGIDERIVHEFMFTVKQIHSELASIGPHVEYVTHVMNSLSGREWDIGVGERVAGFIGSRLVGEETQDAFHPVISLSVALVIEQQADASVLAASGIPDKMLSMLEFSTTPAARAAILMACRTLFRDSTCRESVQDRHAGLLILLRYLTSPVALVRRNAAKALGNYCINNEELKLLAHSMGGTASLFSMIKRGDVLGQEAATATIANLAANSATLQRELGQVGNPFGILVSIVESHLEKPRKGSNMVLKNVARALQNLTGRVNVNRLKAVDAGAIPLMEKLMRLEGAEPRSSAAVALCNMTKCTLSDGFEISSQGILSLLDVMSDPNTSSIAKTGGLLAVKHAASRMVYAGDIARLSSVEIREDHLDALIKFLHDSRTDISCAASKVIGILCESRTERVAKSFVRRGVLEPLVHMLERRETASSAECTLNIISLNDKEVQGRLRSVSMTAHDEKGASTPVDVLHLTRSDSSPIEAVS